jgi:RNA polymerase sigma-70 factor (ECF subfamily)
MAPFGQAKSSRRDELNGLLPKLYKFALVLTAHEQLSRALLRSTLKSLSASRSRTRGGSPLAEAWTEMHTLWAARVAEAPAFRQTYPPEPRLFAGVHLAAAGGSTAHFAKFIASLPSQQRAALYLVYGEGLAYDEAAEIMALELIALMKLLSRGHAALAHWLEHRGLNERQPPMFERETFETPQYAGYAA